MTVTRLAFKLSEGHNYIDLAQSMSMVMRTLIRQKQTFTVLGAQIVDNASGKVTISTAPNFWYTRAAVNRCFKAWKDQRHRVLENANLEDGKHVVGKFADFKITLNGNTVSNNKLPVFTDSSSRTPLPNANNYEWSTASVKDEAGQEKHFMICGDHTANYYGAMMGWLATRALPNSQHEPDMPDIHDAAGAHGADGTLDYEQDYLNLLNETTDGQAERLVTLYEDNDNGPFDIINLYGNIQDPFNLQLQSMTYTSSTNPHHMVAGFKALCGLLHVNVAAIDGSAPDPILFIDVLNTPEAF